MTNILFDAFKTDSDKEVTGVWVYPAGEPTESNKTPPAFKIARAGGANKKFNKVQAALMKPNMALFRNSKDITPERMEIIKDVAKKCFFEAVLLDWRNVFDSNNLSFPFNRENAETLMSQLPDLYEYLMGEAQAMSSFNPTSVSDEAGN
jgi:hypothetical protein